MSLNPNLYTILSEASEPSQVTAQYVWGARPGHRDELIRRDRPADRLYCLMDYFDPTAVIDPSGAVVERYGWSAFGQRRVMDADWAPRSSSAYAFDFGFHGQFLDSDTGYYDYGYRYYSPQIGRWLSRDPIKEAGGPNLYGFAGNDAVNHLDYLGQITIGFYGAKSTTGIGNLKLSEINALVGGERLFGSRSDGEAFDYLLRKLDEEKGNGDGYYGDGDPEEDIKIYGWSWGGITAIKLARKIKESKKFCRKAVKVLYTIDPDEVFYENPTVPDNVITFINRYQTKGTGGLPLDSHGEHRNCEAGVGCENQKDLNPTGNERTKKYPTPGSPEASINHHTIIFEIADELVARLK